MTLSIRVPLAGSMCVVAWVVCAATSQHAGALALVEASALFLIALTLGATGRLAVFAPAFLLTLGWVVFGNENVATSASSTASLDYIVVVGIEWVFSLAACTIGILIAAVGGRRVADRDRGH